MADIATRAFGMLRGHLEETFRVREVDGVGRVTRTELVHGLGAMNRDGVLRDPELVADLPSCQPFGSEAKAVQLPSGQLPDLSWTGTHAVIAVRHPLVE